MTRGNQRDIDRQRAANRHAGKGTASEGDPRKKQEADAAALQAKIAKKAADKAAAEAAGGATPGGGSGGGKAGGTGGKK